MMLTHRMLKVKDCDTVLYVVYAMIYRRSLSIGKFTILRYDKNLFMECATYLLEDHRKKSAKSVADKNLRKGLNFNGRGTTFYILCIKGIDQ